MLDMEDRVGSLERGKDADLIHPPAAIPSVCYTFVEQTWIEGIKVYDRAEPDQRVFNTGGWEVFRGEFFDHYSTDAN